MDLRAGLDYKSQVRPDVWNESELWGDLRSSHYAVIYVV
jgi:hypothetical protein